MHFLELIWHSSEPSNRRFCCKVISLMILLQAEVFHLRSDASSIFSAVSQFKGWKLFLHCGTIFIPSKYEFENCKTKISYDWNSNSKLCIINHTTPCIVSYIGLRMTFIFSISEIIWSERM